MSLDIISFIAHSRALLKLVEQPSYLDFLEALQMITVIFAAGSGLWWFWIRREKAPKVNISHKVQFVDLSNKTVYVGVTVSIENIGKVAVTPRIDSTNNTSMVVIEELSPHLSRNVESQEESPEYKMKLLGARTFPQSIHIEAGETQELLFDFVIHENSKVIKVYSHLENSYNKGKGWDETTIHEVLL